MNYEKLMAVLETDSEDGLMELAAERIKELNSENAGKQKVIDGLETKLAVEEEKKRLLEEQRELKKEIAQRKAESAELGEKEAALRQELQGLQVHRQKLVQADSPDSEIGKLKLARMNIYQLAHNLTEDNNPRFIAGINRNPILVDTITPRKRLCNDGMDPVIDELKQKRMRLYEDSRKK